MADFAEDIAEILKPCERKTLVACVLKHEREEALSFKNPMRVKNHYFAYGPEKSAARRLRKLDLLSENSCFEGTGADIYPSELGIKVAMEVLEILVAVNSVRDIGAVARLTEERDGARAERDALRQEVEDWRACFVEITEVGRKLLENEL